MKDGGAQCDVFVCLSGNEDDQTSPISLIIHKDREVQDERKEILFVHKEGPLCVCVFSERRWLVR